jgi:signal transduction histidine kinase
LKDKGLDPQSVPELVAAAFATVVERAAQDKGAAATPAPAAGSAARVIVSQPPEAPAAVPPASPEAGLVSEELLHRAIRSNVELAEALGDLVREMNLGLASILSYAELLQIYKDESREKRAGAVQTVQAEAQRLRGIVQRLGAASASAPATSPASVPAPRAAAPPAPAPSTAVASPVVPNGLESLVRDAVARVQTVLDGRGLAVTLRIAPGAEPPRPAAAVPELLAGVLEGVAESSEPRSSMALRCERKPVLMRGREGGDIRQDFLMLAISHQGSLPADEQQQVMDGEGSGPLGGAARRVRELGGFVRFAPLPGGALETRVFLPTA